jgi:hypothetical protein
MSPVVLSFPKRAVSEDGLRLASTGNNPEQQRLAGYCELR